MSAVIIISIFLLVLASFAILRSKRSTSKETGVDLLPPIGPRGLFGSDAAGITSVNTASAGETSAHAAKNAILERARQGDINVLADAHATGDREFFCSVLDVLAALEDSKPGILEEITSPIMASDSMRASPALAARVLESLEAKPSRFRVSEVLRIAALSDEAEVYSRAVRAILDRWKDHDRSEPSADNLLQLIESEYWVLSPEAQRSGAGFVLKQELREMRRELLSSQRRESPPSTEAV